MLRTEWLSGLSLWANSAERGILWSPIALAVPTCAFAVHNRQ